MDMYSLDFEEFIWAMGIDSDITDLLKSHFTKIQKVPLAVHERMLYLANLYLLIGGMPEVVKTYRDSRDMAQADTFQKNIIRSYINDIAHYARPEINIKAEKCYRSIPHQLTKENHKFQYSVVEKKSTARKYGSSLDRLIKEGMAVPVHNVTSLKYPLENFLIPGNIRLYLNDIVLLTGTYDIGLKRAILSKNKEDKSSQNIILKTAKGGLYEALAADILTKNGHGKLHFFRNQSGSVEIEFLIEDSSGIVPVEIKAGRNRSKSLDKILENDDIRYGYKFSSQNVGKAGKKITMPLYMLMFL